MTSIVDINTIENQVYSIILEKIRKGIYEPGHHLNEVLIAEELKVSRSPVREAIKRLNGTGLIEIKPNRGAFVRTLSGKEVSEMVQAREMIEIYAVQHATYPLEEEKKIRFKQFQDTFTNNLDDQDRYLAEDLLFHKTIVELLGNTYIQRYYDELYWQINYVRDMDKVRDHLNSIHEEHLKIINALVRGTKEEAAEALYNHLKARGGSLLELS